MYTSGRKYKSIFFDLDNTLWDFKKNSLLAMEVVFDRFNIEKQGVCFENFFKSYLIYNKELWKAYRKKGVSKSELILLRFQKTFDEFQIEGLDPIEINTVYLEEMSKQKSLSDGVPDILELLKSRNFSLYIITNGFTQVQHKKLISCGLKPYFEKIFTSEEIKTPKPGAGIFEYAIKSANAKKKESLMVGDDWETDILGAVNFGMDSVCVDNEEDSMINKVNPLVQKSVKVFIVKHISELKGICGI